MESQILFCKAQAIDKIKGKEQRKNLHLKQLIFIKNMLNFRKPWHNIGG
jgi:hypothetical protein